MKTPEKPEQSRMDFSLPAMSNSSLHSEFSRALEKTSGSEDTGGPEEQVNVRNGLTVLTCLIGWEELMSSQ